VWRWLALSVGMLAAGGWMVVYPTQHEFSIVTPLGIRVVRKGMSSEEARKMLGSPLSVERVGGRECKRYGMPNLTSESFAVHRLCTEAGKVVEVREERFAASPVEIPKLRP
jgi:hypothetical protein